MYSWLYTKTAGTPEVVYDPSSISVTFPLLPPVVPRRSALRGATTRVPSR